MQYVQTLAIEQDLIDLCTLQTCYTWLHFLTLNF